MRADFWSFYQTTWWRFIPQEAFWFDPMNFRRFQSVAEVLLHLGQMNIKLLLFRWLIEKTRPNAAFYELPLTYREFPVNIEKTQKGLLCKEFQEMFN